MKKTDFFRLSPASPAMGDCCTEAKKPSSISDLSTQQSQCDLNYIYLRQLLNRFEDGKSRVFHAPGAEQSCDARLYIEFVKHYRYTKILLVRIEPGSSLVDQELQLSVRVYQDMRCAEVVSCNGHRLRSHYLYPNAEMFSPDEKQQLNRFLGEWLRHCMQHGYAVEANDLLFGETSCQE